MSTDRQGAAEAARDTRSARRIVEVLASELAVEPGRIRAAINLFDEGATVPFIARYRKEATGGLDDTQLRLLDERLVYLRDLEERRAAILASIEEQGKLDPALAAEIDAATTKQRLEDLYLPFKPKRRTRAQIAREAGLEPLADLLLADPTREPRAEATAFLRAPDAEGLHGVADEKAALDGARDILAERFSERADVLAALRERLGADGWIAAEVIAGKEAEGEKFRDYFQHAERIAALPSHRALALFRGRGQGVLALRLGLAPELEALAPHPCILRVASAVGLGAVYGADGTVGARAADAWLADVLRWTWRVRLQPHLETEFFAAARASAEAEAIRVFGANLKDLLLAPPAGRHAVIGLDPGLRTGVKVAVVDPIGKLLETDTIYPHEPRRDWAGAVGRLVELVRKHSVGLVAIGNGTASRETDRLVAEVMKDPAAAGVRRLVVSEAGASVYSASELAAREFPDLDVSLRGAVSIARRLQDPLAELVKIEPKSIGVGQYQHDVNQRELARVLDTVVEDCVNAIGVDVNTASAPLLSRVSGLSPTMAQRIVAHRDRQGAFPTRAALLDVAQFGARTFELAAGFLRIPDGENPLDGSAVHPEAYPVVERILARIGRPVAEVIGRPEALRGLDPAGFADERFGEPTVRDILAELEKPGRDPRGEFVSASFADGIERVSDLRPGMRLQGVVTNVANFGAFVDIGVHQDGLVHISQLSDRFVKDPREAVRAGQVVKVTVLEVDVARKRIALSMKSGAQPDSGPRDAGAAPGGDRRAGREGRPGRPGGNGGRGGSGHGGGRSRDDGRRREPQAETALGAALAQAISGGKPRRG